MRKLLLSALFLGALQVLQAQHMTLGPTIGLNIASISDAANTGACVRPNFGASFVYSINEHFGLAVDALYSMEGSRTEDHDNIAGGYTHLDYLRIPIKASWFFGSLGQAVRPKIFAGVSPAFMVGGKTRVEFSDGTPDLTYDSDNNFTGFDFGVLLGTGLNFRISEATWLQFDVHYTLGLVDISEFEGPNYKNRNLGINVGVGFPIGSSQ